MDSGDKAPGKAITYATKISMLKVFSVETGDNEEARFAEQDFNVIDSDQHAELWDLLGDNNTGRLTKKGELISRAKRFNLISEIPASRFEEILKAAKK